MMILRKLTRFLPAKAVMVYLVLAAASPAVAIVKGVEDSGPMKARTVMILSEGGGVCSGIVIAQDVVLTAGHCVSGNREIRVHFRGHSGEPILLEPAEITTHAGFKATAIETRQRSIDLALIRLPNPLPTTLSPAPLCASSLPRLGTPLHVYGWGTAIENDATTTGIFRVTDLVAVEPYGPGKLLLWAADSFALGKRSGSGVCQGDSGGPITRSDGAVIAISSWSKGLDSSKCGLYTQGVLLGPQRGFIDGTLKRWNRTANWR